ncbi:MAG: DsbA family oxidoreductase, partial [Gammaproteobacteria bacterium]
LVCPWCYVGKRRLERALAARPDLPARLTWLPYQLSPDMPREGKDRQAHYAAIFGPERARTIMDGMRQTAAAEGLQFEAGPGARSPNTLSAHVLLYWAGERPDVDQNAVAEKLFAAHHSRSEDLGDPAVLARVAGEVGMDPVEVEAGLRAGTDEDRVQGLIEEARQLGVTGVPFFIFNGQYAVSGAQPPDALLEVIDRLTAVEASSTVGAPSGALANPPGDRA